MSSRPLNRLGVTFAIDSNIVGSDSVATQTLRQFHDEGWIDLVRADTVETELFDAPDDKRDGLLAEAQSIDEDLGVGRFDHSRWDRSVFASPGDRERFDQLFSILKPGVDRAAPSRQHLRDVMHVDTAIRHNRDAFITHDKGLLAKADAAAAVFGIRIVIPEDAVVTVDELLRSQEL